MRIVLLAALASLAVSPGLLRGQGETTSAIVGTVADPSGAVLPGATVTIVNAETGSKRTAKTDDAGRFSFPQLKPGTYSIKVEAEGFEPQKNASVFSGLGQKQTVNFTLKLATAKGEVTVTGETPLVNPENPNTPTNLNAPALENLPNPGADMTYPLQFAPGALMNTAGSGNDFIGGTNGYGNVQFNGLPALSNGYIVDGLETNDPLTNLNSGATWVGCGRGIGMVPLCAACVCSPAGRCGRLHPVRTSKCTLELPKNPQKRLMTRREGGLYAPVCWC